MNKAKLFKKISIVLIVLLFIVIIAGVISSRGNSTPTTITKVITRNVGCNSLEFCDWVSYYIPEGIKEQEYGCYISIIIMGILASAVFGRGGSSD